MGRTKKLPYVLERHDQNKLLEAFNERYYCPHRNKLMCELMLRCGLRVSEVVSLVVDDVSARQNKIDIRDGKGGKDRVVYVPDGLMDRIVDFADFRTPDMGSRVLFQTHKGTRVGTRYMRSMVKRMAKKAGVRRAADVSPHTLRHTFATEMYRRTNNIRAVQKALGHADLSTTMRYTHIHDGELREMMMAG